MTIEIERRRYIAQLKADAAHPTRLDREQRVAALLIALDLLEAIPPYKPRYVRCVGDAIVRVDFGSDALALQADVQELVYKAPAS